MRSFVANLAKLFQPLIGALGANKSVRRIEIQMNVNNLASKIEKGVSDRIATKEVAFQFVLEELDAARQGNNAAIQFVNNSGFSASEYEGAMQNSFEEVDGANGPQQFLLSSIMQYRSAMDFMVNLRLKVVQKVIDHWQLKNGGNGGYLNKQISLVDLVKKAENTGYVFIDVNNDLGTFIEENKVIDHWQLKNGGNGGYLNKQISLVDLVKKAENTGYVFIDVNNDLGTFIEENEDCDPLIKMAYGYARRYAVAAMYVQGFVKKELYDHVYEVFKGLQLMTGHTVEFQESATEQAFCLISSYTDLFDKESLRFILSLVHGGEARTPANGEIIDTETLASIVNNSMQVLSGYL